MNCFFKKDENLPKVLGDNINDEVIRHKQVNNVKQAKSDELCSLFTHKFQLYIFYIFVLQK